MTMRGKVCLITGGTNGIGKSTAHELARMDATVVIVGRDSRKTSRVTAPDYPTRRFWGCPPRAACS